DARPFMGEEASGTADARLHLVEDEKQPLPIADLAQPAQPVVRHFTDPAFPLHRFDQDRRGLRRDRLLGSIHVGEGNLIETLYLGTEALEIFRLPARRNRRQRAAVEGTFESDDPEPFGTAVHELMAPRSLDRAFQRLGT